MVCLVYLVCLVGRMEKRKERNKPKKPDEPGRRTTSGEAKIGYLVTRWVARNNGFELVSRLGLEPRTLALKGRCSTN
jgi:hypothetical protein